MRDSGCPTAFCGSSGALVWLQTALMCLNYTHNNTTTMKAATTITLTGLLLAKAREQRGGLSWAPTWTLSATRKCIWVGSETWSSQGICEGTGYQVPGTGIREPGTACQPIKCMSKCRSGSHNASRIIPSLSLFLCLFGAFGFWLLPEKTSH